MDIILNGNMKKDQMISVANLVGLLALTGFTIKTNIDLQKKIKDLEEEISMIKESMRENNKRSNTAFARLNQKIQENTVAVHSQHREKITEVPYDDVDEVSSAIDYLSKA